MNQENRTLPLSIGQEGLWFIQHLNPTSCVYNIPYAFRIRQAVNQVALRTAFAKILERQPILRSRYCLDNQAIVRVSQENYEPDFEASSQRLNETELGSWIRERSRRFFNLETDKLLRVYLHEINDHDFVLLIVVHHIIFDGSSLMNFIPELFKYYQAELTGSHLPSETVGPDYSDFVVWQRAMVEGDQGKAHALFWKSQLEGNFPILDLPYAKGRLADNAAEGASHEIELSSELSAKINAAVQTADVTAFVFMLSAFYILLNRYTNQTDLIVGTAVHGRSRPEFQKMIGFFMNMICLRQDYNEELSFLEFLGTVKKLCLDVFAHSDYPFAELVRHNSSGQSRGQTPVLQTAFIFQNWFTGNDQLGASLAALPLEMISNVHQEGEFDLVVEVIATQQGNYKLVLKYDAQLFDPDTINGIGRHYDNLLQQLVDRTDAPMYQYELADSDEKDQILKHFNSTQAAYPHDKCIQELFEEWVLKTPDRTALICGGQTMDYANFNSKVNQLAHCLRSKGLGRNDIAAIIMDRSFEMMIGIFAIIKAGAAYLPIATSYPKDWVDYVLDNSQSRMVLVNKQEELEFKPTVEIIELSDQRNFQYDRSNPILINQPHDLAYIIYTSGTTGNPKGVMLEHHSLLNRLKWMQKAYSLTEHDVILQKTPYTFDVSVWELFWWAFEGCSLCLLAPLAEKYPEEILAAVQAHKVTVMHFVPSMLSIFLDYVQTFQCAGRLASLRQVFASGEALTVPQVTLFNQLLHRTNGTRLMNLYGPTEATIDVSYFDCSTRESFPAIPIGKPIDNIKLYIIDRFGQLLPVGIPGELCIAGVGLARGYLNNPEKTADRFVPDPFDPLLNPFDTAALMYRTGDLARWLPDGNIEYLGRIDRQVKIRGFRIELEEIELVLNRSIGLARSVVLIDDKLDTQGNKQLKAYLVANNQQRLDVEAIKDYLAEKLPKYMVPARFVQVAAIPLSGHGKVDQKALLKLIPVFQAENSGSLEAASYSEVGLSDIERVVMAIYAELLGHSNFDPHGNFFDLGGHSILLVKVGLLLKERLDVSISTAELFQYPSAFTLAQFLQNRDRGSTVNKDDQPSRGSKQRERLLKLRA